MLTAAGFPHPGHTESFGVLAAHACATSYVLACPELRVVPVTVHEPLARRHRPPDHGDDRRDRAHRPCRADRRDFGITVPLLAIAGLNPHAGEDGTLGTEDRDIVAPAVAALRAMGIAARGPVPPDTMFTAQARPTYDAAICRLYHDQALIPIKTLDMAGGVNVTLGLSIVRTSPDHGTALDIAGTGRADPASLIAAIRMAAEIARNRAR